MKLVSIVIPAYNEEEAIGMVLDDLFKTLKRMKGYHFETIVVNNNRLKMISFHSLERFEEVIQHHPYGLFFVIGRDNDADQLHDDAGKRMVLNIFASIALLESAPYA